jgi:elongation factor Ts
MSTTTEAIKKLRAMTGAGMMDVKKALDETGGDIDKAAALLRERGIAKAAKKADRDAREGLIGQLRPPQRQGRRAGRGQLRDRLRRAQRDLQAARPNLALHVAMANPQYLRRDDVPEEVVEAEKQALRAQAFEEGKPEAIVDRMVEGASASSSPRPACSSSPTSRTTR